MVEAAIAVSLGRIGILTALVAALGIYLYAYERPNLEREAAEANLLDVETDAVTALTLTFPDRTIALERRDDRWTLTAPVEDTADATQVRSLLGSLMAAKIAKTLDDLPDDLSDFGLATPEPVIRLTAGDTPAIEIRVGRNTSIGNKTYVQMGDDDAVHLTQSNLRVALDKKATDFRDKQLLTFEDDAVSRVVIRGAEREPLTLERVDANAWTIEPGGLPADLTEVRSYLSSLRSTRAVGFPDDLPEDPAASGFDAPHLTVAIFTDDPSAAHATLQIGNERQEGEQTQVYAKRAGRDTIVTLGQWSLRSLDQGVNHFRDKTVLGFDLEHVGKATFDRTAGDGLVLERNDAGGWALVGSPRVLEQAAVTRLLTDLRDLKGSDVVAESDVDLAAFGLDTPELRIVLSDRGGEPIGTVLLTRRDDKYYTSAVGAEVVYETRDYMYTRLDKTPDDLAPSMPPAASDDG